MAFERMDISERDIKNDTKKPSIKLTRYGDLRFNSAMVDEFKLSKYTHAELFYDSGNQKMKPRVQIMLFAAAGKNDMRLPIRHINRKGSKQIVLSMIVKNTFRARGIELPTKATSLPFILEQSDILIIGIPMELTSK